MERPLCPLCKTNHFAREPHDFGLGGTGNSSVGVGSKISGSGSGSHKIAGQQVGEVGKPVVGKGGKVGRPKIYADAKLRRREYMREYRKRVRAS